MLKSSFPIPNYSTESLYGVYSNLSPKSLCSEYLTLADCLAHLENDTVDVANSVSYETISYLLCIMRDVMVDHYLHSSECAPVGVPEPTVGQPTGSLIE